MNLISHKYKSIFIHIPKNGGTTITSILTKNNWKPIDDINKYNNYYKFLFVRNPYDRYLSGWKRTKAKYSNENKKMEEFKFNIQDFHNDYKLLSILDKVNNKHNYNIHFYYTQTKIINNYVNNINDVNDIYYLEEFSKNILILKEKFNLDISNIEILNKSQIIDNNKWLNNEIKEYIYNKYKEDFINFNYKK